MKYLRFQNCCNWYSAEPKADSGSEDNDNQFQETLGQQPSNQLRNWFTENVINGINLINNDNNDSASDEDPESNHNKYIFNNIGNLLRNKAAHDDNLHEYDLDQFDEAENNPSTTLEEDQAQTSKTKPYRPEEDSDDDDEDFDMYLQDYINMYTNDQTENTFEKNQKELNYDGWEFDDEMSNKESNDVSFVPFTSYCFI